MLRAEVRITSLAAAPMIDISLRKRLNNPAGGIHIQLAATLPDGSLTALFGPSGAGKTSVLRLLAGLLVPDAGHIVVDGETWFDSQRRIHLPPRQRAIGLVFQDYALFPNLSVRGNVAYAAGRGDAAWVDYLLESTGLAPLHSRLPATLSGGQQQRVALARALARRPRLLLLDEPLSALHPALRRSLQDLLADLHQQLGLTTLLVSHDLAEVFRLAGQVIQMAAGQIQAAGTPQALFLQRQMSGKLNLHGQVLHLHREEVIHVVTVLVGQEMIDVVVSGEEAAMLGPGDTVTVSIKAFGAMLQRS